MSDYPRKHYNLSFSGQGKCFHQTTFASILHTISDQFALGKNNGYIDHLELNYSFYTGQNDALRVEKDRSHAILADATMLREFIKSEMLRQAEKLGIEL